MLSRDVILKVLNVSEKDVMDWKNWDKSTGNLTEATNIVIDISTMLVPLEKLIYQSTNIFYEKKDVTRLEVLTEYMFKTGNKVFAEYYRDFSDAIESNKDFWTEKAGVVYNVKGILPNGASIYNSFYELSEDVCYDLNLREHTVDYIMEKESSSNRKLKEERFVYSRKVTTHKGLQKLCAYYRLPRPLKMIAVHFLFPEIAKDLDITCLEALALMNKDRCPTMEELLDIVIVPIPSNKWLYSKIENIGKL